MRPSLLLPPIVALLLAGAAPPPPSRPAPATLVPAGDSGAATIRDTIRGREDRDYVLHAGAGQSLDIELRTRSTSAYMNVLPPGSSAVAMFIGDTGGGRFRGIAPIAGDYVVRVYLVRSAARRNERAAFTLAARVRGAAWTPRSSSVDATHPGTPFHARTSVRCVLPYQPDVSTCEAWVIRYEGQGNATVELRGPGGFLRRILFERGEPVAGDATTPPTFSRDGDTTVVRFGDDERYDVPDALVSGG